MRDGFRPVTILVRDDIPEDLRRDLATSRVIDIREAEPRKGENVAGVIVYLRGEDPEPGEKYDGAALAETVEGLMADSLRELYGIMYRAADKHAHFICKGCGAGFCSDRDQYAEMKDGDACPECHIAVVEKVALPPFVGAEEHPGVADVMALTETMRALVNQFGGDQKEMMELRTREVRALERIAAALLGIGVSFHEGVLRAHITGTSDREMPRGG